MASKEGKQSSGRQIFQVSQKEISLAYQVYSCWSLRDAKNCEFFRLFSHSAMLESELFFILN